MGPNVTNSANYPWSWNLGPTTMDPMRDLEIDVRSLPQQVSPPDHWQEHVGLYGLDPEVFFPTTEEEAGLALSYCGVCSVREIAWRGPCGTASATGYGAARPNSSDAASFARSPEPHLSRLPAPGPRTIQRPPLY